MDINNITTSQIRLHIHTHLIIIWILFLQFIKIIIFNKQMLINTLTIIIHLKCIICQLYGLIIILVD